MVTFIDTNRQCYGVELICKVLPIAPATYYRHRARRVDPTLVPARVQQDVVLCEHIKQIWEENFGVYGVRKVWRQLAREGIQAARCTVERLMRQLGLQGVRRGKSIKTTVSTSAPCPQDHVNRHFNAPRPNALWVADFTPISAHGRDLFMWLL